jgi:hypothetical protein
MKIIDGPPPDGIYPAIEVQLWPSPKDPKVSVATVSLFEVFSPAPHATLKITKFVERKRMNRDQAVVLATQEATARNIDTVYVKAKQV